MTTTAAAIVRWELFEVLVFANILETGRLLAVSLYSLEEHLKRSHPKPVITIECTVQHHSLLGLAVMDNIDELVKLAFEMAIFTDLYRGFSGLDHCPGPRWLGNGGRPGPAPGRMPGDPSPPRKPLRRSRGPRRLMNSSDMRRSSSVS